MTKISKSLSENQILETVVSITKAFIKYDFQTMLDYIIKTVTEKIDAVMGGIFLLEKDTVVLVAEVGGTLSLHNTVKEQALFPSPGHLKDKNYSTIKGLAAQTVLDEKTIVINDISTLKISKRAHKVVKDLGMTNLLSSPIMYHNIPHGVIQVARTGNRPFNAHEVTFIEAVTAELGIVIIQKSAIERANETMDELEFMVDLLTHDVSSQSMVIWSCLEEVKTMLEPQNQDGQFFTQTAIQALTRVQTIIDQVRVLSSLKRLGRTDYTPIAIGGVINRAIKSVESMFPDEELDIQITISNDEIFVNGTTIIDNCFMNLLQNAILADNHTVKKIKVNITENNSEVIKIEIEDQGEGIPEELKPRVFQRLFRARSQEKPQGSGLGLFIVKTVIEKFDGRICVENRVRDDYTKGTRFVIELPRIEITPYE
ncbi:MAG: GAF domain-containing sensor histidine kinase [Candidatus Hodarchaeales archaeon]